MAKELAESAKDNGIYRQFHDAHLAFKKRTLLEYY